MKSRLGEQWDGKPQYFLLGFVFIKRPLFPFQGFGVRTTYFYQTLLSVGWKMYTKLVIIKIIYDFYADIYTVKHPSLILLLTYSPGRSTVSRNFQVLLIMFYVQTPFQRHICLNTNVIILYTIIQAQFSLFNIIWVSFYSDSYRSYLILFNIA